MRTDLLERKNTGLRHEALLYSDRHQLRAELSEFLSEGGKAREPTLVVLPRQQQEELVPSASDDDLVTFLDAYEVGRNPARLISLWYDFVTKNGEGGGPLRIICEAVWPQRSADELVECQIHEQLLETAYDGRNAWTVLCPYDTGSLPQEVVDRARQVHTLGSLHDSLPAFPSRALYGTLPPAPRGSVTFEFDVEHLSDLRRLAGNEASRAGVHHRVDDFVFSVNEIATNSLAHGGGRGTVRLWTTARGVVGEVLDQGHIRDPLIGRRRPGVDRAGGQGLWLANQLCDLVQVRSQSSGTVVRLHVYSS